ncbi:MAG: hypothetical protein HYZ24_08870 [Chloroflexi bacterium]|nr:hypothetical protein [Chloroflexota bacterium]
MITFKMNPRLILNLTVALALLVGSAASPTPARAASMITVTTSADNTTTDTFCSLREAITNANDDAMTFADCAVAGSGNDTIVFANGITTVTLGSTLPTITDLDGLVINGGGDVTIDGSDTYRILIVDTGISLTLESLTLKDGACTSCLGGGVYSSGGILTITNSVFNSSQQAVYVYNGTTTITNSTFSGNSSTYGGAVNASGSSSVLTVSNSVFSNNDSPGGGGSAIYSGGTMTVTNSSFTNNTATSAGAGSIFNDGGGSATVKNSTFTGIGSATTRAIYNNSATLTVSNSTFSGNESSDYGGGILNSNGTLTIKNSTFSGNKAPSGGADIYQYGASASLNLYNSILANENGGGNCVLGDGTISANNNLIEDPSNACGLTNGVNGNIIGSDPALDALTGSPAYFPLTTGSPAIDAGDDAVCAASPVNNESQNGLTRPQGPHCDIGSYEASLVIPADGAVLQTNRPTFDWVDVPGATVYQIQVSKVNTFSTTVLNKTTPVSNYTPTGNLNKNTLYYWRVRAKVGGVWQPWSSVWSFTTGNPPSVPTLQSPANGAKVNGPSPLFNWSNSTVSGGAVFDHYQIQIATDNAFTNVVHDLDIAGVTNSQDNTAVLNSATTYYWRVRSFALDGDYSGWSLVRSVKIKYDPPTLLTPADTSVVGSLKPTFTWSATVGATSYRIQVSRYANFSTLTISTQVAGTTFTPGTNLLSGKTYYWRVRVNGTYGPSAWSVVFSFTTP